MAILQNTHPTKAPSLPLAPTEYQQTYLDQLLNTFRLYFNTIDNAVSQILTISGGTVSQLTSRATGVTIDQPTGKISMFSAAGSATPATFVVTNASVGANDTVVLNMASGNANIYLLSIAAISAGSFTVLYYTTGGLLVDAPVINFTVVKGANA